MQQPPSSSRQQEEEEKEEAPHTIASHANNHKNMVECQIVIGTGDDMSVGSISTMTSYGKKYPSLLQPSSNPQEPTTLVIEYDANHNKVYHLELAAPDDMSVCSTSAMSSSGFHPGKKYTSLLQPLMPQEEEEKDEILPSTRGVVNDDDAKHNIMVYPLAVAPDEISHGNVGSAMSSRSSFNPDEHLSLLLRPSMPQEESEEVPPRTRVAPDEMSQGSAGSVMFALLLDTPDERSQGSASVSAESLGGGGCFDPDESLALLLDTSDVKMLMSRILQETHRLRQKIQKMQATAHAYEPPAFSWHGNHPGWRPQPTSSLWIGTKAAKAFPKTWNCASRPSPSPYSHHIQQLLSIPQPKPHMHGHPTVITTNTTKYEWGEEKDDERSRVQRLRELSLRYNETLLRSEF